MTKKTISTLALVSILALFLFRYYMGPDDNTGPLFTVEFVCWLLSVSIVCIYMAKQELSDFYHGKLTPKQVNSLKTTLQIQTFFSLVFILLFGFKFLNYYSPQTDYLGNPILVDWNIARASLLIVSLYFITFIRCIIGGYLYYKINKKAEEKA